MVFILALCVWYMDEKVLGHFEIWESELCTAILIMFPNRCFFVHEIVCHDLWIQVSIEHIPVNHGESSCTAAERWCTALIYTQSASPSDERPCYCFDRWSVYGVSDKLFMLHVVIYHCSSCDIQGFFNSIESDSKHLRTFVYQLPWFISYSHLLTSLAALETLTTGRFVGDLLQAQSTISGDLRA